MNRWDLQKLARLRLSDAKVLLENGNYDGAYYLAGYAVECALKACIAKRTKRYDFPDKEIANKSYTHNLHALIKMAGLGGHLDTEISRNADFEINWTIVKDCSEASRYERNSEGKAQGLYLAITHRKQGVLRWIRQHW